MAPPGCTALLVHSMLCIMVGCGGADAFRQCVVGHAVRVLCPWPRQRRRSCWRAPPCRFASWFRDPWFVLLLDVTLQRRPMDSTCEM